jgi:hypothetical protein
LYFHDGMSHWRGGIFDDADRQQIGRRRAETTARTRAPMAHTYARRRCGRRRGRRRRGDSRLLRSRKLLRHRCGVGSASNLEVITAPTQVDDPGVVRVFQNSHEHAIAETFRIATEQLPRATAHVARLRRAVSWRKLVDGATHEVERLASRETLTSIAGGTLGRGGRGC